MAAPPEFKGVSKFGRLARKLSHKVISMARTPALYYKAVLCNCWLEDYQAPDTSCAECLGLGYRFANPVHVSVIYTDEQEHVEVTPEGLRLRRWGSLSVPLSIDPGLLKGRDGVTVLLRDRFDLLDESANPRFVLWVADQPKIPWLGVDLYRIVPVLRTDPGSSMPAP